MLFQLPGEILPFKYISVSCTLAPALFFFVIAAVPQFSYLYNGDNINFPLLVAVKVDLYLKSTLKIKYLCLFEAVTLAKKKIKEAFV